MRVDVPPARDLAQYARVAMGAVEVLSVVTDAHLRPMYVAPAWRALTAQMSALRLVGVAQLGLAASLAVCDADAPVRAAIDVATMGAAALGYAAVLVKPAAFNVPLIGALGAVALLSFLEREDKGARIATDAGGIDVHGSAPQWARAVLLAAGIVKGAMGVTGIVGGLQSLGGVIGYGPGSATEMYKVVAGVNVVAGSVSNVRAKGKRNVGRLLAVDAALCAGMAVTCGFTSGIFGVGLFKAMWGKVLAGTAVVEGVSAIVCRVRKG